MEIQTGNLIEFAELKQIVLNMIDNTVETIETNNSCKDSGVYLLYIDCFEDDKIIPFYIGKTNNFQRRYQQHKKAVNDLIEKGYADYYDKFFWSAVGKKRYFEGKYLRCKILKYIIDHNCSVADIKMIVLEKCENDKLDERERYFIGKYLSSFFGFNQIATITEQMAYHNDSAMKKRIIENDYQNFLKYMEYGYSTFNYLHAFSCFGSKELDEKVNSLTSNHLWPAREELFSEVILAYENYVAIHNETFEIINNKFADSVHEVFSAYKIKSKSREKEVLASFTNKRISAVNYLRYYFNRDKRSQKCGEVLEELYNENRETIESITRSVEEAFGAYIKSKDQAIELSEFSIIFTDKIF